MPSSDTRWGSGSLTIRRNLKLVNRQTTYSHNDPNAADPKVNAFIKRLIPFLRGIGEGKEPGAKKKGGKKK